MSNTNKLNKLVQKVRDRYNEHKEAYKNNFILTLLWMLLVCIVSLHSVDTIVKDNNLDALFYGPKYKRR